MEGTAAYQSQIYRGAIQSVGGSQMKAVLSLGMTKWEGIRHIILPQALRKVISAFYFHFTSAFFLGTVR
ncbi:binding-protein-dependent transport system inner membrane component [Halanaerobium sp. MA284_MarDTE_T2]|nr:binding-protein-dependent transport system inner membrane component [Halanaerobium sp. MA284_MarDTE_T2]RCW83476.1 binding-protein-dependent transport system inner membrane component [Halanaerobium sp. DL-01]